MKNTKIIKIIYTFIAILFLFFVQTFASKSGDFIANLFDYTSIDKDGTFMYITIHHIVQMLVALLVIFVIKKKKNLDFCLKPEMNKTGILHTIIFAVVILIYVLVSYSVGYKTGLISPYEYQLDLANVLGTLGFQLLLSGTSEEILFRALPITFLISLNTAENKKNYLFEILIASLLFSVAHISWTIFPFTLSFSWFQLIYAFILGIAYGITYIKSKSVIYPMIMHGISNFFMVGIGYIFMLIME